MKTSKLNSHQEKTFGPVLYTENGNEFRIFAKARYDDRCKNGHNDFGMTAEIDEKINGKWHESAGGCCHDEITKHFPELAKFVKFHLMGSNSPMHYVANTVYHAKNGNLDYARSTAIWPDASIEQLKSESDLMARLPALRECFSKAMTELGFEF